MNASDHRARARAALKGNWLWAVLTTLVATLLGGISGYGGGSASSSANSGGINLNFNVHSGVKLPPVGQATAGALKGVTSSVTEMLGGIPGAVWGIFIAVIFFIIIVAVVVSLLIGGPVGLGYRQYTLNLIDGKPAEIGQLFSQFKRMGTAVKYRLLTMAITAVPMFAVSVLCIGGFCLLAFAQSELFQVIWGLASFALIFGVGIGVMVVSYGLVLAEFILAEDLNCTASEAIRRSWRLMNGNKWRYFCLGFSFIGWALLCGFTLGIGGLFLNPYQQVAFASFYRELCPPPAQNNGWYNPAPPVTP